MKFHCINPLKVFGAWLYRHHDGEWHRWYAWHPVKLESGQCAWLETVERKYWDHYHPDFSHFQYQSAGEGR